MKKLEIGEPIEIVEIKKDFIPKTAIIRPYEICNDKKYIVIHNTGNYGIDADAKSHSEYLRTQAASENPRRASWHYTVDDKAIYYHIPDNESAWHAGDGSNGKGNFSGIGIEICVNGFPGTYVGADYEKWESRFKKAIINSAKLTAYLLRKYNIDMSRIKQHYDFAPNKKNCPMQMRYTPEIGDFSRYQGKLWNFFLEEVKKQYRKDIRIREL